MRDSGVDGEVSGTWLGRVATRFRGLGAVGTGDRRGGARPAMGGHARPLAEVSGFINLLLAACDSPSMNQTLERVLSLPDERRRNAIHLWVSDLLVRQAPEQLVEAIAALRDDGVAEQAYAVIFQCQRSG